MNTGALSRMQDCDIDSLVNRFTKLDLTNQQIINKLNLHDSEFVDIKKQLALLQTECKNLQVSNQTFAKEYSEATSKIVNLMEIIANKESQQNRRTCSSLLLGACKSLISVVSSSTKFAIWSLTPFLLELHRNAHNFARRELNIESLNADDETLKQNYSILYWKSFEYQLNEVGITGQMFSGMDSITQFLPDILPSVGKATEFAIETTSEVLSQLFQATDSESSKIDSDSQILGQPIAPAYLKQLLIIGVVTGIFFTTTISCYCNKRKKRDAEQNDQQIADV
jgi:hypothetical protein